MARANLSSIDTTTGDKLAFYGNREKATMKQSYNQEEKKVDKQLINSRKQDNLAKAKAKTKKKAKLAKASKKRNKK